LKEPQKISWLIMVILKKRKREGKNSLIKKRKNLSKHKPKTLQPEGSQGSRLLPRTISFLSSQLYLMRLLPGRNLTLSKEIKYWSRKKPSCKSPSSRELYCSRQARMSREEGSSKRSIKERQNRWKALEG